MEKFIKVANVTVVRICCECGALVREELAKISAIASICDKCDHMENFLEIIGVEIKE